MKTTPAILLALLLALAACRRSDVRTAQYRLPPGLPPAKTQALLAELSQLDPNSPAFSASLSNQTVTVVYDSMILARKNIELILEKYGPVAAP